MARVETPTMTLMSAIMREKTGKDLKTFLAEGRAKMVDLGDGTMVRATWDDVAFEVRTISGRRIVRETVKNWARRYGIPEPEHNYGVPAEQGEPAAV